MHFRHHLYMNGGMRMGDANNAIVNYLTDKRRFADLFNAVLYGGRQVLDPEKLTEISGATYEDIDRHEDNKRPDRKERRNDITMRYKDSDIYCIFIGEAQNNISYILPVRNLGYLAAGYRRQLTAIKREHDRNRDYSGFAEMASGLKKDEKLVPIHIIWVYHGEDPWDGPRSLRDLLDFGDDTEAAENYSLEPTLLCLNELTDASCFHTELGELIELLNRRNDKKALLNLVEKDSRFDNLDEETLEAASVLMNEPSIWNNRHKHKSETGEGYSMCTALKEWRDEIIEETTERVERETTERVEHALQAIGISAEDREQILEMMKKERANPQVSS